MARLSDLPAEIILQICSFVRPGLNGKNMVNEQNPFEVRQKQSQDYRNLNSLKSFCRTSKKYNGLRDSILFTSIVENHNLKEGAVESIATLLRVLLANPGGRIHVRSLHMFLYAGEDMDEDTPEIPWPLSPSQIRALENVAAAVGINTTKKIRDLDTGRLITLRGVAKNTKYLRSDRLFGYEMLLLLLLVPGVQDLTLVINSGTLDWMRHIWATARLDGVDHSPITHLRSLVICDGYFDWVKGTLGKCFGTLFEMLPSSELYGQLSEIEHAQLPFSNITSLALCRQPWTTTELCQVIEKFSTLNSLLLLSSSVGISRYRFEAAAVIDALRKHARTLRTLCLQRFTSFNDDDYNDDEKRDRHAIADLRDFVAMEKLWITAALLRAVNQSSQKQKTPAERSPTSCEKQPSSVDNVFYKLPSSLRKLHLHGKMVHLLGDFRHFSYGNSSINFNLSLSGLSGADAAQNVVDVLRKVGHHINIDDKCPLSW
ncbi:hypothetical protein K4K53_001633 [Colletotrichum sp. SAR 10_77]|nr:hypothetical protein K4K53_001633 [Colletotrichum sp. SAR 10_77]